MKFHFSKKISPPKRHRRGNYFRCHLGGNGLVDQEFLSGLKSCPVIAAVRDMEGVRRAALSPVRAIFILGGSILNLGALCDVAHGAGKRVFVHLDLCEGLGKDVAGVDWCVQYARPDGLISTRSPLLKRASEKGLMTIQRLFLMDSASLNHGSKLLSAAGPDMVEVLPALVPKAITRLSRELKRPVIAGGMATEPMEVVQALQAGALAVSTSERALWSWPAK